MKLLSILSFIILSFYSQNLFSQKENMIYFELKQPLNMNVCSNCFDGNIEFDFKEINSDYELLSLYKKLINVNFLALDVEINNKGLISKVAINETYNKDFIRANENQIHQILKMFLGKMVFKNLETNFNLKTTLSFFIKNDELILNPITHS